jgi:type IV pilus assembly protein PilE
LAANQQLPGFKEFTMSKQYNQGFSLIELMIVVAIIGVLASIAYPAYTGSVLKGKRAEGRAALAELMQQQERFMTQTNSYCAFSNSGGTATAVAGCTTVPFKTFSGDNAAKTAYYLSAAACASTTIKECVEVSAQPIGSDPEAGTLRMQSTGTKSCSGTNSTVCW